MSRIFSQGRLQVTLQAIFLVTLFVGLGFGWLQERLRVGERTAEMTELRKQHALALEKTAAEMQELREQLAISRIEQLGGWYEAGVGQVHDKWSGGDAGLVHFKDLPKLYALSIRVSPVTDAGLAHIGKLKQLKVLDLWGAPFTDEGLGHLSDLKELKDLDMSRTQVTRGALKHLEALTGLETLHATHTPLESVPYDELKKHIPSLK